MNQGVAGSAEQQEASKLLVDVAKVAITLGSGAIAVNGAFLKDEVRGSARFWFFLASIGFFIVAVLMALTAITQTLRRAGGEIGDTPWNFGADKPWLTRTSIFGMLGITCFVAGTIVASSAGAKTSTPPTTQSACALPGGRSGEQHGDTRWRSGDRPWQDAPTRCKRRWAPTTRP